MCTEHAGQVKARIKGQECPVQLHSLRQHLCHILVIAAPTSVEVRHDFIQHVRSLAGLCERSKRRACVERTSEKWLVGADTTLIPFNVSAGEEIMRIGCARRHCQSIRTS